MSFTDVPLRVSQLSAACSFCKIRKIKCDGVSPACGGCVKYNNPSCSLKDERRGPERDYVTYLERRIQNLSRIIDSGVPEAPLNRQSSHVLPGPDYESPSRIFPNPEQEAPKTIDDLISEIGALPILPSTFNDSSEGPSLAAVALAASGCKNALKSISSQGFLSDNILKPLLPKRDLAQNLINHYLTSFYPRIPFFSIQGLWMQVELAYTTNPIIFREWQLKMMTPSGFAHDSLSSQQTSPVGLEDDVANDSVVDRGYALFTVLMVLSISTSSLSKHIDSMASHNAEELFHAALRFRDFALIPNTILGLQSMLFLVQYATLNPSRLDAWYLIGVGMRICIDLGLQNDPEEPTTGSLLETRRRLFWSMYSFDRSLSMGLNRPCELLDEVIHAGLPEFRIDSSFSDDDIQIYKQRYIILHLQSIAYNRLCFPGIDPVMPQEVSSLCSRVDEWKTNNPLASVSERSVALLESEWLQARMIIYRPCYALPSRSKEELLILWEASLEFVRIYRKFVNVNEIFYIQIACEKVYAAGLNILHAYWQLSRYAELLERPPNITDLWAGVSHVNVMMTALSSRWENGEALARKFEQISSVMLRAANTVSGGHITLPSLDMGLQSILNSDDIDTGAEQVPDEVAHLWKYTASSRTSAMGMKHGHDMASELQGDMKDLMFTLIAFR